MNLQLTAIPRWTWLDGKQRMAGFFRFYKTLIADKIKPYE
jgi:hypothetical protein